MSKRYKIAKTVDTKIEWASAAYATRGLTPVVVAVGTTVFPGFESCGQVFWYSYPSPRAKLERASGDAIGIVNEIAHGIRRLPSELQ